MGAITLRLLAAALAAVLLVPWPDCAAQHGRAPGARRRAASTDYALVSEQQQQQQQQDTVDMGATETHWGPAADQLQQQQQQEQQQQQQEQLEGSLAIINGSTNTAGNQGSGSLNAKVDIEQLQYTALKRHLSKLLIINGVTWPLVDGLMKQAPTQLGQWIPAGHSSGTQDYSEFIDGRGWGYISVTLVRTDGAVYITELYAFDAGIDLNVLPPLVARLPKISSFTCSNCFRNRKDEAALKLPASLAAAAPASLTMVSLGGCKLKGSLPEKWGSWKTLEQLWVWDNLLTGSLPTSWSDMSALRVFYAEQNGFTGVLPDSWGTGSMPDNLAVYLHKNKKLSGTVPTSWARFTGVVDISGTNVTGCVPDALVDNVIMDGTPEPCSLDDPNRERSALVAIREGLRAAINPGVLPTWMDEMAMNGSVPNYCSSWQGVACSADNKVTMLDVSYIAPEQPGLIIPLSKMMQYVKRLQHLEILNLADLALVGPMVEDKPLADDLGSLATYLTSLKVLNISNNPGITGKLPRTWAGLTSLQVLDVSGCGVNSLLPEAWVSLQQLQVFRAAGTQVYGALPDAWGMMKSLVEVDLSNCQLTGKLPSLWADAIAMQAVAEAAVQAAQAAAEAAAQEATKARETLDSYWDQLKSPQLQPPALRPPAGAPGLPGLGDSLALRPPGAPGLISRGGLGLGLPAGLLAWGNYDTTADTAGTTADPAAGTTADPAAGAAADPAAGAAADPAAGVVPDPAADAAAELGMGVTDPAAGVMDPAADHAATVPVPAAPGSGFTDPAAGLPVDVPADTVAAPAPMVPTLVPAAADQVPIDHLAAAAVAAPANASEDVQWAMQEYQQVQQDAETAKQIADALQQAMARAADKASINGLGLGLMRLEVLRLSNNQLTGPLPVIYSSFRRMRVLDLSKNGFAGSLPLQWAAMDRLQDLNLSNNARLSGTLPDYWARLTNLVSLDLSGNALVGRLPFTWLSMQNVVTMDLSNNMFSDKVPQEWEYMKGPAYRLRCLVLFGNAYMQDLETTKTAFEEGTSMKVVIGASEPSCKQQ